MCPHQPNRFAASYGKSYQATGSLYSLQHAHYQQRPCAHARLVPRSLPPDSPSNERVLEAWSDHQTAHLDGHLQGLLPDSLQRALAHQIHWV